MASACGGFGLLCWTGIRCGELLALTPSDFMLESSRLRINKSWQSLRGVDTVTDPKTPKSVRTIVMPAFLRDGMADFIEMCDDVAPDERLFAVTKRFLAHETERGCKASGVKRIRIRDMRHGHVSLLIEMGFSTLAIAERMGHEAVDITCRYARLFPTKQEEMAAALDGAGGKKDAVREQRPQAQQDDGVSLHARGAQAHMRDGRPERYEQAGLHHRQAHDTQVEVKPSVSVQKALKDSMAELTKEVRLAASYGELSESLRQRIKLVMEFFLALGEPVDALPDGMSHTGAPPTTNEPIEGETDDDASIFELGWVSACSLGGAAHYAPH